MLLSLFYNGHFPAKPAFHHLQLVESISLLSSIVYFCLWPTTEVEMPSSTGTIQFSCRTGASGCCCWFWARRPIADPKALHGAQQRTAAELRSQDGKSKLRPYLALTLLPSSEAIRLLKFYSFLILPHPLIPATRGSPQLLPPH